MEDQRRAGTMLRLERVFEELAGYRGSELAQRNQQGEWIGL